MRAAFTLVAFLKAASAFQSAGPSTFARPPTGVPAAVRSDDVTDIALTTVAQSQSTLSSSSADFDAGSVTTRQAFLAKAMAAAVAIPTLAVGEPAFADGACDVPFLILLGMLGDDDDVQ